MNRVLYLIAIAFTAMAFAFAAEADAAEPIVPGSVHITEKCVPAPDEEEECEEVEEWETVSTTETTTETETATGSETIGNPIPAATPAAVRVTKHRPRPHHPHHRRKPRHPHRRSR